MPYSLAGRAGATQLRTERTITLPFPVAGAARLNRHLHQRQRDQGPLEAPKVVRVISALFPEARRRGLTQQLRLWHVLRAIVGDRGGRFRKYGVIEFLVKLGWGRSTVYRLLKKGKDILWTEQMTYPHGTHGRGRMSVVLVGAVALAEKWEIERLSQHTVEVPWSLCVRSVAEWNAAVYHAQLPGPRQPRVTKLGVQRPRPNHPYSRRNIRKDTGIPERSQIRYHKLRHPATGRAVTRRRANFAIERVERKSKRNHFWSQRRLGNSYTSALERKGFGKGKVFNKKCEAGPYASDAHGPSNTGRPRRFFENVLSLMRFRQKGRPLYRDAMFRILPRNPWLAYVGWWEVPEL